MTDRIRQEIQMDLHATSFGEGIACDYHARPETLPTDGPVLIEAIKLIDHPQLQLDEWPSGWVLDTARCDDHAVDELEEPTRGFEEALVQISVQESNGVVSVDAPESDDLRVLAFSPADEGCHPMLLDQQLMNAAEPGDLGLSRWNRVQAIVSGGPAEPFREHVESLIERSHEIPQSFE